MSYRTPDHRRAAVREVLDLLRAARRVILTTHLNADGDGAGCEAAMASWLRALGAEAWIVNPTTYPDAFRFVLEREEWVVSADSSRAEELTADADLALVLDTGEIHRIGRVKPLIQAVPTIVVDHHPAGDSAIAGTHFRDPRACATGELCYDLLLAAGGPWTTEVVEGLYLAIMTDTGSFRFSNSTPGGHVVAAELIERGVDPEAIYRHVYGSFPLRRFRILEASLEHLDVDESGLVAWMTVPREICESLGAEPEDLDGLVDYPRSVSGVEVGLLFRETGRGQVKISLRSNGRVDVNVLARRFGGGGHVRASGALVKGSLDQVRKQVVEEAAGAAREVAGAEGSG